MKNYYKLLIIILGITTTSCNDLDLLPLSQASSEGWYSSETEIEMSLKDGYRMVFWPIDDPDADLKWTDDWFYRQSQSEILNGTLNGQNGDVTTMWTNQYKAIARANLILANMEKAASIGVSESKVKQFTAEAYFLRACRYACLIAHFGDVPYVSTAITIEEAFEMGRTPKEQISPLVYADYDKAIENLPVSYPASASQRATKGAAMAMKARFALYMGDWEIAATAAKACMDLGVYKLHEDFANLFLPSTKNAEESIFLIPRSIEYGDAYSGDNVLNYITRNAGGYAARNPSWDLLASFLCTDGLPIDESPLFDPHDPFKNRDPRCNATIVPFGSRHLGFDYNPHPEALEVMNYNQGRMQSNNDNRAVAQFASFNGLVWKKGIDESWLENGKRIDPDRIIIRYADVLLMYAEAKIELNQIDQSVLDAINQVRARAYGVNKADVGSYPAVTTTDQTTLRKILRIERRMEFAKEGLRYMDLIRWKLATKALTTKIYGLLYPASLLVENVVNKGGWFWPRTPQIDDDGIPDFTEMEKSNEVMVLSQRNWNDRQYLWPIPTKEIFINPNLVQNPGY
jgi:hypothetical protein